MEKSKINENLEMKENTIDNLETQIRKIRQEMIEMEDKSKKDKLSLEKSLQRERVR